MIRLLEFDNNDGIAYDEFFESNAPPYAILSHTWGKRGTDVTFDDLRSGRAPEKDGYRKLLFCGKQAQSAGLRYFWIDSCCIDKSNSAELTTAINSMFRWYQKAEICYVYLSDVRARTAEGHQQTALTEKICGSRWFRRGWTLQELLAPRHVDFFSRDEEWLGSKRSLKGPIHKATGIPVNALDGTPLDQFSVDKRLSWMQGRETHEVEDMAYSLLGIFGVYMPLLYGEGQDEAFQRLQEVIRKRETGFWYRFRYLIGIVLVTVLAFIMRQSVSPVAINQPASLNINLPVFAVIGKTGAGKSSFIKTLGGQHITTMESPVIGDTLRSCTKEISWYRTSLDDEPLYLIDTPGFDDDYMDDNSILKMIWDDFKGVSSMRDRTMTGIIFLYDITQPRMGGAMLRSMDSVQNLLGHEDFHRLALVTTSWSHAADPKTRQLYIDREAELIDEYWRDFWDAGAEVMRYDGTIRSAKVILQQIILNRERKAWDLPRGGRRARSSNVKKEPTQTESLSVETNPTERSSFIANLPFPGKTYYPMLKAQIGGFADNSTALVVIVLVLVVPFVSFTNQLTPAKSLLRQSLEFSWFLGHLGSLISAFSFAYTRFIFSTESRWADWYYRSAFLWAAIAWELVIIKTFSMMQKKRAKATSSQSNDSAAAYLTEDVLYFLLSLMWLSSQQIALAVLPFGCYSTFHVLRYSAANLLPTSLGNVISTTIRRHYDASMVSLGFLEIALWLRMLLSTLNLTKEDLLRFVAYTIFLRFRYSLNEHFPQTIHRIIGRTDASS